MHLIQSSQSIAYRAGRKGRPRLGTARWRRAQPGERTRTRRRSHALHISFLLLLAQSLVQFSVLTHHLIAFTAVAPPQSTRSLSRVRISLNQLNQSVRQRPSEISFLAFRSALKCHSISTQPHVHVCIQYYSYYIAAVVMGNKVTTASKQPRRSDLTSDLE